MQYGRLTASSCAIAALLLGHSAGAQDLSYNLYGVPGLIDTPTGRAAADAEISATISAFRLQQRGSFSFQ